MEDGRYLEKSKNRHIWVTVRPIGMGSWHFIFLDIQYEKSKTVISRQRHEIWHGDTGLLWSELKSKMAEVETRWIFSLSACTEDLVKLTSCLTQKLLPRFGMEFTIPPFLRKHDDKQVKNTRKCISIDKITLQIEWWMSEGWIEAHK